MNEVELRPVSRDEFPALANLLELYIHDLSAVFDLQPGPDGRFGYEQLPLYGSERDRRFAFFICIEERLAGFALVQRGPDDSAAAASFDLAEFFVLRRERQRGVGRLAAFQLWDRLPGGWLVRVAADNRSGLSFWRAVIREYAGASAIERPYTLEQRNWHAFAFPTRSPAAAG